MLQVHCLLKADISDVGDFNFISAVSIEQQVSVRADIEAVLAGSANTSAVWLIIEYD